MGWTAQGNAMGRAAVAATPAPDGPIGSQCTGVSIPQIHRFPPQVTSIGGSALRVTAVDEAIAVVVRAVLTVLDIGGLSMRVPGSVLGRLASGLGRGRV